MPVRGQGGVWAIRLAPHGLIQTHQGGWMRQRELLHGSHATPPPLSVLGSEGVRLLLEHVRAFYRNPDGSQKTL